MANIIMKRKLELKNICKEIRNREENKSCDEKNGDRKRGDDLKGGKKCNFSQKILIFQAKKKSIFGSFKNFSGAKIVFVPFRK